MALKYDEPVDGPLVTTDPVGSPPEHFEVVKIAFGSVGAADRVDHGVPLPARDYHGGTQSFDSDPQVVAAGSPITWLAVVDIWVDVLLVSNLTGENQPFTLANGDAVVYGSPVLAPNEIRIIPFYGLKFSNGIGMFSEAPSSVLAQVKGTVS